jgi:hypothetical protein
MADLTVGQTITDTLRLYDVDGETPLAGKATFLAVAAGIKPNNGSFTGAFGEIGDGVYRFTAATPTDVAGIYSLYVTYEEGDRVVHFEESYSVVTPEAGGDPWAMLLPGTYEAGSAGNLFSRLATSPIVVQLPAFNSANPRLVQGDDYRNADGRAILWQDPDGATWPTLTGATITLTAYYPYREPTPAFTASGTVVTATGVSKSVRVDITAANTADLTAPLAYPFDVQATLSNGHKVTLVVGKLQLVRGFTP